MKKNKELKKLNKLNKFLDFLGDPKFVALSNDGKAKKFGIQIWEVYNFSDKLKAVGRIEKGIGSDGYKVLDPKPLSEDDYLKALECIREHAKILKNDPSRKARKKNTGVAATKGAGPIPQLEGPIRLNGEGVRPLVDRNVKVTFEGDAEAIRFLLNGNGGK